MRIVVAVDAFKGCLRSVEAGAIIADGLRESLAGADVAVLAVADGGEGTTDAVLRAAGGVLRRAEVTGPLGGAVSAGYGLLPDGRTAVLEMASASGLELVAPERLDPLRATTFGTGELVLAALDAGARDLVIGVGGSATVDGGMGMAQALGWGLLRADGSDCGRGGAALATLDRIDALGVVPALAFSRVRVACDVTNPLLGAGGAARVFGPQKGASPEVVELLESGLAHLAEVWRREGLLASADRPGDGAAGGLGAGLRAFCRAQLCSGADLVADLVGFDEAVRGSDLVVTGEGRTDAQTAHGKLPAVLARRARAAGGVRTFLLAGAIESWPRELDRLFDGRLASVDASVPAARAIAEGPENLAAAARELGRRLAAGSVERPGAGELGA